LQHFFAASQVFLLIKVSKQYARINLELFAIDIHFTKGTAHLRFKVNTRGFSIFKISQLPQMQQKMLHNAS
jgi:hypothetical protein